MYFSFSTFFIFLAKIQVLLCVFFIFHMFHYFSPYSRSCRVCFSFCTFFIVSYHISCHEFQVSHRTPCPTVCNPHFPSFSGFFALCQVLECVFLIFHVFECFLPYSRSNSVCVSFSTFFSFLPRILVLQCVTPIFYVFQCSRHNPGPTVCISHFSRF